MPGIRSECILVLYIHCYNTHSQCLWNSHVNLVLHVPSANNQHLLLLQFLFLPSFSQDNEATLLRVRWRLLRWSALQIYEAISCANAWHLIISGYSWRINHSTPSWRHQNCIDWEEEDEEEEKGVYWLFLPGGARPSLTIIWLIAGHCTLLLYCGSFIARFLFCDFYDPFMALFTRLW